MCASLANREYLWYRCHSNLGSLKTSTNPGKLSHPASGCQHTKKSININSIQPPTTSTAESKLEFTIFDSLL
ncbi:hypothetical protein I7I50_07313 [Histoplasma capsulatum G186AR]|uniref:Uncharacterized protein n=1 Tax=Ajellomyces capsulatus TaxID=5037 RepID=A0A8H7Z1F0_AJECA|nr:hypothetical protein I7I52_09615 [Histoplasma capsulatum]QSS68040.1 hypothetical protein I7I50_07313 [Histoplasma capsulatum G186AR]